MTDSLHRREPFGCRLVTEKPMEIRCACDCELAVTVHQATGPMLAMSSEIVSTVPARFPGRRIRSGRGLWTAIPQGSSASSPISVHDVTSRVELTRSYSNFHRLGFLTFRL